MRGIVTIDGPSASGKSSVARRVAAALGVPYLSSGLLYRAAAFLALRAGVDPGDEEGLLALLEGLGAKNNHKCVSCDLGTVKAGAK